MKTPNKHLVIPIFIPHQGCPHQCLFCNQRSITGIESMVEDTVENIGITIDEWLFRSRSDYSRVEVAFYGGSFTCMPLVRQKVMLNAVQPFIASGRVDGIRLSTRPDCVDSAICRHLSDHGVVTVELGVQSLDDTVLMNSERGHSSDDCREAVEFLSQAGLNIGIQLMPGLPGETTLTFLKTVKETIRLRPALVRLYPVLVVRGSGLAQHFSKQEFQPLSLNKAIALTGRAKELFDKVGIRVIRMGLQPSKSLEDEILAGPYHPAFGELVTSRSWFKRARKLLAAIPGDGNVEIHISSKDLSAFIGPRKMNYKRLGKLGLLKKMTIVTEKDLERGSMYHVIS